MKKRLHKNDMISIGEYGGMIAFCYYPEMVQDSPSRQQDQFVLRMPQGMRDRISAEAKTNNRSMNAEIIARLEASFGSGASSRLNWLLDEIFSDNEKLSPSLIAERIGEENSLLTSKIFAGSEEPSFAFLDRITEYLAVNGEWLKRGVGNPFNVSHERDYGEALAKKLIESPAKKITLVRSTSPAGEVAIVFHYDSFRCEVLETALHLSDHLGSGGEGDAARFSETCEAVWSARKSSVSSVAMTPDNFHRLISGSGHALGLIARSDYQAWFDDWWDPTMFMHRNDPEQYWPGYRAFCMRIREIREKKGDLN